MKQTSVPICIGKFGSPLDLQRLRSQIVPCWRQTSQHCAPLASRAFVHTYETICLCLKIHTEKTKNKRQMEWAHSQTAASDSPLLSYSLEKCQTRMASIIGCHSLHSPYFPPLNIPSFCGIIFAANTACPRSFGCRPPSTPFFAASDLATPGPRSMRTSFFSAGWVC